MQFWPRIPNPEGRVRILSQYPRMLCNATNWESASNKNTIKWPRGTKGVTCQRPLLAQRPKLVPSICLMLAAFAGNDNISIWMVYFSKGRKTTHYFCHLSLCFFCLALGYPDNLWLVVKNSISFDQFVF